MFFYTGHIACAEVIDEKSFDGNFLARNVLTRSDPEDQGNFWATQNYSQDYFILDLGWVLLRRLVQLVNTHSAGWRDKSTKEIKVFLKTSLNEPWQEVVHEMLADSRQEEDPLPLLTFEFSPRLGRYVKVQVEDWYGVGGGLQYFNIIG